MATRQGVEFLFANFGPCIRRFYSNSYFSKASYLFLPNSLSYTVRPLKNQALARSLTYVNAQNVNTSAATVKGNEVASGCPICSRNLTFTYKDVLLLAQFISPEGNILNRRVTGVCRKQQRRLEKTIEISRRMGLIPKKPPAMIQKQNQAT